MALRVRQPPLNAALRAVEQHNFWPGFVVALFAAVLLFYGARRLTGLDTTDGNAAWETQLVKAFSSGGLKFPEAPPPPPPPGRDDDPIAAAAALERWQRQVAQVDAVSWKVRIDTEASTPCPT